MILWWVFGDEFLNIILTVQSRRKVDVLNFIKIKNLYSEKDITERIKRLATNREKNICKTHI